MCGQEAVTKCAQGQVEDGSPGAAVPFVALVSLAVWFVCLG